jgi:hypothetical protein
MFFYTIFTPISPNVPAVNDVFLRPIRKNAKHFTGAKKCGGAKHHKGRKPDWCFA